ncbi:hypothetical protein GPECTOR_72g619 [Gonium pectorale]|uniref:Uncharacterized protein n=1 Tax=Gonium pectorale TaxID=33097 RepID=A0A150G2S3_GONPE|nr:hypothetical protein GPECTOR_72g619 [Gonium pectorale]|eukprot:KXZ44172.1 hypothetical protein GPECTOR_72g619 [Gonium pectorale]
MLHDFQVEAMPGKRTYAIEVHVPTRFEILTRLAGCEGNADVEAEIAAEITDLQLGILPKAITRALPQLVKRTQGAGGKVLRNWSLWGRVYRPDRANLDLSRAEKLIYIKGNRDTAVKSADEEIVMTLL